MNRTATPRSRNSIATPIARNETTPITRRRSVAVASKTPATLKTLTVPVTPVRPPVTLSVTPRMTPATPVAPKRVLPTPLRTPKSVMTSYTPKPSPLSIFSTSSIIDTPKVVDTPKIVRVDPVMAKIQRDLNSPSAAARIRANKALKSPNFRKATYEQFDVPHEKQHEFVTREERLEAAKPPPTIAEVFKNCKIYVEVRTGDDNRSEGIKGRLIRDGIKVNDKLWKDTTHVVFKDGLLSTFKNAVKLGIPVVTILWVDACKSNRRLVDPSRFKISNLDRYEHPELYKRMRRQKSAQPRINNPQFTLPALERSMSQNDSTNDSVSETVVEDIHMELTLHKDKTVCATPKTIEVEKMSSDMQKWKENVRRMTTYTPNPMEQTEIKNQFLPTIVSTPGNHPPKKLTFNSSNRFGTTARRSVLDLSLNILEMNCKSLSEKTDETVVERSAKKIVTPSVNLATQVVKPSEVRKRKLFTDDDTDGLGKENFDKNLKELDKSLAKRRRSVKTETKKTKEEKQRRETVAYFKPQKEVQVAKPKTPMKSPVKYIVLTNMDKTDKQILSQAITELGGKIETEVSVKTTHVVTPNEERTMNVVRGVIRACFIVKAGWIHDSLAQKKWLDTTLYQHNVCDSNRVHERQVLGSKVYSNSSFSLHGPFYLDQEKINSPKKENYIREIITLCGGTVTDQKTEAGVIVGDEFVEIDKKKYVTATNIFDSAMKGTFQKPTKFASKSKI